MSWELVAVSATGAVLALFGQAIIDWRHINRTREHSVADKVFEFQLQVLSDLDLAIRENTYQAAIAVMRLDNMEKESLRQEYERFRSNSEVVRLVARVQDKEIREAADACYVAVWKVFSEHDPQQARNAFSSIAFASSEFHKLCGAEILRLHNDLN